MIKAHQEDASQPPEADLIISPGLSVHLYGSVVGIYCSRIDAGQGFVELPTEDMRAILKFFSERSPPL